MGVELAVRDCEGADSPNRLRRGEEAPVAELPRTFARQPGVPDYIILDVPDVVCMLFLFVVMELDDAYRR